MKNIVLNKDSNFLKLVGIITMLIDHIGCILFPHVIIFRIIGRIAFPLFCYTTLIGYYHTKNVWKYILRLLVIGIISQPIYMIAFDKMTLNIMFTLIFVLLLYYSLDKKKWYMIPFIVIFSFLFKLEYSATYMFLVPMFYYFSSNKFITIIYTLTFYFSYAISETINPITFIPTCVTAFACLYLPFVLINTNLKIKLNKYFFYLFYPIHILILFIIKSIM